MTGTAGLKTSMLRFFCRQTAICAALIAAVLPGALNCTAADSIEDYVSAELYTARDRYYIGEQFEIVLTIKSHSVILGQDFGLDPLTADEIRKTSTEFSQYQVERRAEGGRIYELRKFSWTADATATGRFELASSLRISVLRRKTTLFFSTPQQDSYKIQVRGPGLEIIPLPENGRSSAFSGAVGKFTVKAELEPLEALPGDVITLRTHITGSGSLENAVPPELKASTDIKTYRPKTVSSNPLIIEQQFIPLNTNGLTVPSLDFSYFDPLSESYQTCGTGPLYLKERSAESPGEDRFLPVDRIEAARRTLDRNSRFSRKAAVSAGLAAAFAVIASVFLRIMGFRKSSAAVIITITLAAAVIASFMAVRKSGYFDRNSYILRSRQHGRLAPSSESLPSLAIPEGTRVKYLSREKEWVLVQFSGVRFWIPEDSLARKQQ